MGIDEAKPGADLDVAHPAGEEEHHLEKKEKEEQEEQEEQEDDHLLQLLQCHLPVHIPATPIQV